MILRFTDLLVTIVLTFYLYVNIRCARPPRPPRGSHPSHNHLNPNSQSLFVSPVIRIHTRNKRHPVSSLESIKPPRSPSLFSLFAHSFSPNPCICHSYDTRVGVHPPIMKFPST